MTRTAWTQGSSMYGAVRNAQGRLGTCAVVAVASIPAFLGCNQPLSAERELAMAQWVQTRDAIIQNLAADANQTEALAAAQEELDGILRREPHNESAKLLLAHVLLEAGRLEQSAILLRELERDGHANPQVYYLTGVTKELVGDYPAAARYYARALRERPGHQPYITATAEALLAAGNVRGARAFLGAVDSPLGDSPKWLCGHAEAARSDRRYEQAAALYKGALEIVSAAGDGDEWVARRLADVYQKLDRYEDAAEILEPITRRPQCADPDGVREQLAWCNLRLKRADDAAELINALKTEHRGTSALWTALAQLHLEQRNWSQAKHALSRAFIADPSDANARMLSTFVSLPTGDTAAACRTIARTQNLTASRNGSDSQMLK